MIIVGTTVEVISYNMQWWWWWKHDSGGEGGITVSVPLLIACVVNRDYGSGNRVGKNSGSGNMKSNSN